jgi:hypothetical protein
MEHLKINRETTLSLRTSYLTRLLNNLMKLMKWRKKSRRQQFLR